MRSVEPEERNLLRNRRKGLVLAAATYAMLPAVSRGANVSWAVDSNGLWTTASDWSNSAVPVASDVVTLDRPAGNFNITADSGNQAALQIIDNESLTLAGGFMTVGDTIYVGSGAAGTLFLSVTGVASANTVSLGIGTSDSGNYSLSAGTMTVSTLNVGLGGAGQVAQSGGTLITTSMQLGNASTASGSYTMSGGLLKASNAEIIGGAGNATFTQTAGTNTATSLVIGAAVDTTHSGTYTLQGGFIQAANATVGGAGNGSLSAGTFNISGGDAIIYGSLTVADTPGTSLNLNSGTLAVGTLSISNPSRFTWTSGKLALTSPGAVTVGAGTIFGSSLALDSTRILSVDGALVIPAGAAVHLTGGQLSVSTIDLSQNSAGFDWQTGTLSAGNLIIDTSSSFANSLTLTAGQTLSGGQTVGDTASGTLTQTGGVNNAFPLIIGNAAGSSGTYNFSDGTIDSITPFAVLTKIGVSGAGTFNQNGGVHEADQVIIALASGSTGTYSLSAGTLTAVSQIVGASGTASVIQSGSSTSSISRLTLGSSAGGVGNYTFSGGALSAGTLIVGSAGAGTLVQSGGSATATTFTLAQNPGSTGTYSLSAGTLRIIGSETTTGGSSQFIQTGGTHTVTTATIGANGTPGATASYSLSDGALNATSLYVGGDSISSFGQGTLTINGGSANIIGAVKVYDAPGTALNLSAGTLAAASLDVSGNPSRFSWTGGTLSLSGSDLLIPGGPLGAAVSIGPGMQLNISGNGKRFYVGNTAAGSITQSGGAVNATLLAFGEFGAAPGTYTLSGGSLNISGGETIGVKSDSTFVQSGGAHTAGHFIVGLSATGTYSLSAGTLATGVGAAQDSIGFNGQGIFVQTGGTYLSRSSGGIGLGVNSIGRGNYSLSAGTLSAAALNVGGTGLTNPGQGTFNLSGGLATFSGAIAVNLSSSIIWSGGSLAAQSMTLTGSSSTPRLNVTAGDQTFAGSVKVTSSGSIAVASGASLTLSGPTTFAGASLDLEGPLTTTNPLSVTANTNLTGTAPLRTDASLSLAAGVSLDLGQSDLIASAVGVNLLGTIRGYLQSGFNGGAWNGTGLASSNAHNDTSFTTALGYSDAGDLGVTTFDSQPVPSTAVLVKYTYYGDSNLDGKVDGADFQMFLNGFAGVSASSWSSGDYTYDGKVDIGNDFYLFLISYLNQGGSLGALAPLVAGDQQLSAIQQQQLLSVVPEPASTGVLAATLIIPLARRRRRPTPIVDRTSPNA
jgi:fibronectin-binding autotransporter adhesin